jgi:iron complex outermembrane receptor protein
VSLPAWADPPLEVDVAGPAIPSPPKDPFAAGSVITSDQLQSPGAQASDVLRGQPGINVIDTGGYGSFSTASVRGATAAQTPVYLAGIRLNDDVGGGADLSLVPLWLVHRIEIYRSNAPLQADQLGIGGAIFFEPRRPTQTETSAGSMAGSYGARSLWGHAAVVQGEGSALVGVRYETAQNNYPYLNDNGTLLNPSAARTVLLPNADVHVWDVWGYGTYALGHKAQADLLVNVVNRNQGLPGLAQLPSTAARADLSRELTALRVRFPCGSPGCEVTATTSLLLSQATYDDPRREIALGTSQLDIGASRVEEGFLAYWPVTKNLSLAPQAQVAVERLSLVPAGDASVHAERVSSRAALSGEWQLLDDVAVRAMGSAECHATSESGKLPWGLAGDPAGAGANSSLCQDVDPSARLGLRVGHENLVGLVNGGRYVRIPTLAEQYGVSGLVRGNIGLRPEQGLTVDLGVRAESREHGISVDLFGFLRQSTDLIAYERSSFGDVRPYNVGAARTLGGELFATYRPLSFLRADLSATVLDARNVSATLQTVNDVLPYLPRLVLTPRVEVSLPGATGAAGARSLAQRLFQTAKVSAAYFYESSRYVDPAGLVVLPEQGSLDLEAETTVVEDHITLRGRVANALDQTRTDLIGYPLPGRSLYLSMEARW